MCAFLTCAFTANQGPVLHPPGRDKLPLATLRGRSAHRAAQNAGNDSICIAGDAGSWNKCSRLLPLFPVHVTNQTWLIYKPWTDCLRPMRQRPVVNWYSVGLSSRGHISIWSGLQFFFNLLPLKTGPLVYSGSRRCLGLTDKALENTNKGSANVTEWIS